MNFRELLNEHNNVQVKGSHTEILGDAFLLKNNPIYSQVRTKAQNLGVKLIEADAEYLLMPFHQLDKIVASKEVPFIPHGRLMKKVEDTHPGVFGLEHMPIPESYHMHESAHVIAHEACAKLKLTTPQDRILKAILCESFANTVDALACGYADSDIHRTFLKFNCYMQPTEEAFEIISRVREAFGGEYVAKMILLSYIHANFLRDEVPLELLEAGMNDEDCIALSTIGQELDVQFREQTTANYFRLDGIQGEHSDLLNFDFMTLLRRSDFAGAFRAMVSTF